MLTACVLFTVLAMLIEPPDPGLALGRGHIDSGRFDSAVTGLDDLIRKLTPLAGSAQREQLTQALVYKGWALVGLEQESAARAAFREAQKIQPSLRLRQGEYPPRVIRVFEAARKGTSKSVLYAGGGIGVGALVAGGLALAGGGTAAAALSGGRASETFSGSLQAQGRSCRAAHGIVAGPGSIGVTLNRLNGANDIGFAICSGVCPEGFVHQTIVVGQRVELGFGSTGDPPRSLQVGLSRDAPASGCPAISYEIQVAFPR